MHAAVTRLMNNVRAQAPGIIDDAIKYAMFNVLDKFFQTTNAWKEDIDVPIRADDDSYEIQGFEPGVIFSLISVVDSNDVSVSATMIDIGTLKLNFTPSATDTYTATVALTVIDPTDDDGIPQFPDWVLQKYGVVILDGILGELFAQKAKPWSDERLAIFHQRKFRNGMATARVTVNRQNNYSAQAWTFPSFA